MANLFSLEVNTPFRLFFNAQVECVIALLVDGEIGIYANHAPFTAPVAMGVLKIKNKEGKWQEAFTTEGIIEVKQKKVIVMVETAEWFKEMDKEHILIEKQDAEKILKTSNQNFELSAAKYKLKKAETKLKLLERSAGKK